MEPEIQAKCPACNNSIEQSQFRSHIKSCERYSGIAYKQIQRLPSDLTIGDLKMIVTEFDICKEYVKNLIAEKQRQSVKHEPEDEKKIELQIGISDNIVQCLKCTRKFYSSFDVASLFYVHECWHLFCLPCIKKYVNDQFINSFGNLLCLAKGCKQTINQYQLKGLLGDKFESMQQKAIRKMMNLVECTKCNSQYQFLPGNPRDAPKKDNNGKPLTAIHAQHYAENRFTCPRGDCKTEQCKECKAMPFHIGMTCKEYKSHAEAMKCRYCDVALTQANRYKTHIQAHTDICNGKQCQQLVKGACTKMLGCGHACPGFAGQKNCLPCLNEKCCEDNPELNGQTGQDYCNICFIEALTAAPCVRSSCGHIFHEKCVRKRYQIRWLTPRVLFNFCLCPLCKKWINLPEENTLYKAIKQNTELYSSIQKMSAERLKFQECDKDEKLTDPKSPYYGKPNEYAMAIYAYFECFKCKKPYFGGRKNCADAMNEAQNQGSYDPKELICPNCCEVPIENCPKHGKDFIEFKCKFCCAIAQWFCWGNTHFCQPCHKRQCSGDYVSKYTKDKLPKCEGPGKCPSGGNHGGNGEEKTLGCAICRNYKANVKNF